MGDFMLGSHFQGKQRSATKETHVSFFIMIILYDRTAEDRQEREIWDDTQRKHILTDFGNH